MQIVFLNNRYLPLSRIDVTESEETGCGWLPYILNMFFVFIKESRGRIECYWFSLVRY